jgi:3-deoxy-manno-octulosonate cytidylyltransferase (CMP-KDO synthetase)
MNTCIIIPSRYASSRFPGKALIDLCGKSMIYRVWKICCEAISSNDVYVATESELIKKHCDDQKINVIMTSDKCLTGTDRVAEAYEKLNKPYDVIINVQGDEPLIKPNNIISTIEGYKNSGRKVTCAMSKIYTKQEYFSPNVIKIVIDRQNNLLYASRSPIPGNKKMTFSISGDVYKQVCIYAFNSGQLKFFRQAPQAYAEYHEEIEMLRFIECGYDIHMVEVDGSSISVDIPEDADRVRQILNGKEELCKNF